MKKHKSPHIILVGPVAPPIGGVTRWTSLVTDELQEQQVLHSVVNTSPKSRRLDGQSTFERIGGGFQSVLGAAKKLTQRARSHPPTAVHISSSGRIALLRDIAMALIGKWFDSRTLLHLHHGRLPKLLQVRSYERLAMDVLASLLDTLVVLDINSAAAAKRRWPKLSVEVIANPVATQTLAASREPQGTKELLYLGYVEPKKGVEDLLQVWMELAPEFPTWRLSLVGGVASQYRDRLTKTYPAERWNLTGEVAHQEAMSKLASSELLVLPSYSEGFPNVILEAMSFGKAVVATTVGGIPAMLSQGEGLLVTPGEQDQLKAALSRLMADDRYRAETGCRGAQRVDDEYNVSKVVHAYRDLWEGTKIDN